MKMGFWKLLAAVAAFFAVMSLSAAVSAVDMDLVYEAGGYSESDIELMEKITDMISSRSTATLDIEKYDLSYSELEDLYGTVVFNHPEFFYVSMVSADLDYKTKDKILAFTPIYTYSAISSNKMKKQIERAADEILSGIDSSMTVPEKVLYIHDAIVSTCDYYEGKASNKGRTVWSTLIEKSSVCVGYSLTFQYFMDRLDIPCMCITNEDHIWNMVEINKNWYHVDTTWDDMNAESPNLVMHDMVLLSEYGLDRPQIRHPQWRYGMIADSSKYDDMFWADSYSKINYHNGWWYYNTKDGLCRYRFSDDKEEIVSNKPSKWYRGNFPFPISFGKNIIVGRNVLFSTAGEIWSYDIYDGSTTRLCSIPLDEGSYIFDFEIADDSLIVYYSDDYKHTHKYQLSYKLKGYTAPEKKRYIYIEPSDSKITISWDDVSGAEQYILYRYDTKTGSIKPIERTIQTSVTIDRSADETRYRYAFKVRTAEGTSRYSEWRSA